MNLDNISASSTSLLASASLKACVMLAAGWVCTRSMKRLSSASRHLIWTLCIAGTLVLPMAQGLLPMWKVHVLPAPAVAVTAAARPQPPVEIDHSAGEPAMPIEVPRSQQREPGLNPVPTPPRMEPALIVPSKTAARHSPLDWLLIAWIAGATAVILRMLIGIAVISIASQRANQSTVRLSGLFETLTQELRIRRRVRLLIGGNATMPLAFGIVRPAVWLPAQATSWSDGETRSVLLHELAHVRRWDCATQLIALLACAIHWFNPLVWFAAAQMRAERERACDDIVMNAGSSPTEYAEYLVRLARGLRLRPLHDIAAVAMARRSGLGYRVASILQTDANRRGLSRRAKLLAVAAVVILLAPLSALHFMKRTAMSSSAMAAEPPTQPTTSPAEDASLPTLPEKVPAKRIAVRVLSPEGKPIRIDAIKSIMMTMKSDMRWSMGPTPEIRGRYADGWVLTDRNMFFALSEPAKAAEMTFASRGVAVRVSVNLPNVSLDKIELQSLANLNEIGIDTPTDLTAGNGELAGEVVDPFGKPVEGAVVSFPSPIGRPLRPPVTTAADGVFRFSGLTDQWIMYFQVEKPGFATRLLTDAPLGRGFLVHLDNQTRIKGRLLGTDDRPAAHAKIKLVTSKPTLREQAVFPVSDLTIESETDENGNYDFAVEPNEYDVSVAATNGVARMQHFSVASTQTLSLTEKLIAGITLKVLAVDSVTHQPAAGVKANISEMGPGLIGVKRGSERTAGTDGSIEWPALTPGPIQLRFSSDNYGRYWTDETIKQQFRGIDEITVDLKETIPTLTVYMEPAVQVSGTVLTPNGQPVSNAMVDIAGLNTGDARYQKKTDANGTFKLTFPILKNEWGREIATPRYAIVAKDWDHQYANATGEWFEPKIGEHKPVVLKTTAGGLIRGRVTDSSGKPVLHLEVRAQADDTLDRMYFDPRSLTDDNGQFEIGPMRTATYSIYLSADVGTVTQRNDPPSAKLQVADGDHDDIGDLVYDGVAPKKANDYFEKEYGKIGPSTQGANDQWRKVDVAKTAMGTPVIRALPTAVPNNPAESDLTGAPADPGTLAGKVVDADGHPLEGVELRVWTWTPKPDGFTDAKGEFSLKKLDKERNVEIRFTKAGYCPRYIVQQPTGLSGLTVAMNNKTCFEGAVVAPDGKPVAGAKIRADQGPKHGDGVEITSIFTETTSGPDGKYKLLVQADAYDIQVRVPGVGAIRTGKRSVAEGKAEQIDLKLLPHITFRARVVDTSGKPIQGVRLYDWQNEAIDGRSDAQGNLVIDSMLPGRFNFEVEAKGYARWWSEQASSEWARKDKLGNDHKLQRNFDGLDFDLSAQTQVATIVVEPQVTIRGKVLDPDGQPVKGATVAPALTGSGNSLTGDTRYSVLSKDDGSFDIWLPASGDREYNLMVHDGDYRNTRKWANGVLSPIRTTPGQQIDAVTLTLTRPAKVSGRVVDGAGKAVANREVRAAAADLRENRYYDPTTRTDEDGRYTLAFIRTGEQLIQVAPLWLKPADAPQGTSKSVELGEGQSVADVDLTAVPTNNGR